MTSNGNHMDPPEAKEVRKRIEEIVDDVMRIFFMALYLFCARASELCGEIDAYDLAHGKHVWGPSGDDAQKEFWADEDHPEMLFGDVARFTLQTAKRKGFARDIGLPLDPKYEPWTQDLLDYWGRRKGAKVFPFTRHKPKSYLKKDNVFMGLEYPITKYILLEDGIGGGERVKTEVDAHMKPLVMHGLRHVRAIELMERYHFNLEHVALYGGWTLKSQSGAIVSPVLMRHYLQLGYRFYIGKLMR